MKNVHILPTDKPSKLRYWCGDLELNSLELAKKLDSGVEFQHIYITSNEEIKEGDWFYDTQFSSLKAQKARWDTKDRYQSKIILTTDQDLIEDGVQPIDDEFLEWFVNNSICERVEVIKSPFYEESNYQPYKIIFPQEEPNYNMKQEILEEMERLEKDSKQETLEEAAEKYIETSFYMNQDRRADIRFGANWQAERMYSEEDLRQAFKSGGCVASWSDMGVEMKYKWFDEWFKQFKNKKH